MIQNSIVSFKCVKLRSCIGIERALSSYMINEYSRFPHRFNQRRLFTARKDNLIQQSRGLRTSSRSRIDKPPSKPTKPDALNPNNQQSKGSNDSDLSTTALKDLDTKSTGQKANEHASKVLTGNVEESMMDSEVSEKPTADDASELAEEEDEDMSGDDFLTTIFDNMEPYLDTYDIYITLLNAGFTAPQAEEIISLLIVQLNSKLLKLTTKYSQLYQLENEKYLFESAQQELRVDITRSRGSHINELVNLIQILERDFNIISDELNNAFIQMKHETEVAMNDQKSENTLHAKKINLRIQETNHKITTELNSAMRSEIESLRWHISRWGLIAILVSVFSGCTIFYVHKVNSLKKLQNKDEFVPLVIYEPSEFDEDDYHTDLDESIVN